jgi:cytochrome c oxidase subunit 1
MISAKIKNFFIAKKDDHFPIAKDGKEVLFMLIPWSLGWIHEINIPLARTLFWFFGHPLVYFWLLPAYIMYYVFLPQLAGGKLFSENAARLVFLLFIVFSIPVGVHHQFTEPGISQNTKWIHSIFTFLVGLPSLITAFTVAASLEYAGRKHGATSLFGWMAKLPYFDKNRYLFSYLITGLIIFIFGGITGIVNASYKLNLVVHNTAWISGHFHLTVAGPVILAMLGGALYMVEQITGKTCPTRGLAVAFPYLWMLGLFLMSSGLMLGGLHGEPRRTNLGLSYLNPNSELYRPDWEFYTTLTVIGGTVLFIAAILYFISFFGTLIWNQEKEPSLQFPTSESITQEARIPYLDMFMPWIAVLILLIAIAYTPTIVEVVENTYENAPEYKIDAPVPYRQLIQPTNR